MSDFNFGDLLTEELEALGVKSEEMIEEEVSSPVLEEAPPKVIRRQSYKPKTREVVSKEEPKVIVEEKKTFWNGNLSELAMSLQDKYENEVNQTYTPEVKQTYIPEVKTSYVPEQQLNNDVDIINQISSHISFSTKNKKNVVEDIVSPSDTYVRKLENLQMQINSVSSALSGISEATLVSGIGQGGDGQTPGSGEVLLQKLDDVNIDMDNILSGQVIMWDGTSFVPASVSGVGGDVTSVSGTSPIDVSATIGGGKGDITISLDSTSTVFLDDLDPTMIPDDGECLSWDGTQWSAAYPPGNVHSVKAGKGTSIDTTITRSNSNAQGEVTINFDANLSDIKDVDSSLSASSGQVLMYQGGEWQAGDINVTSDVTSVKEDGAQSGLSVSASAGNGQGAIKLKLDASLNQLKDVVTGTASAGDVLTWNAANGSWSAATPAGGGATGAVTKVEEGSDGGVKVTSSNGDGTGDIDVSLEASLKDLGDVDDGLAGSSGQALIYGGGSWSAGDIPDFDVSGGSGISVTETVVGVDKSYGVALNATTNNLNDVDTSSGVSDDDVLVWETNKFKPKRLKTDALDLVTPQSSAFKSLIGGYSRNTTNMATISTQEQGNILIGETLTSLDDRVTEIEDKGTGGDNFISVIDATDVINEPDEADYNAGDYYINNGGDGTLWGGGVVAIKDGDKIIADSTKTWQLIPSTDGGANLLDELDDVIISGTPDDGQILVFDSGNFINVDQPDIPAIIYSSTEPTDATLKDGDLWVDSNDNKIHIYDTGAWVEITSAKIESINQLTDVDISSSPPTDGQILAWSVDKFVTATGVGHINDLTDVDIETNPIVDGQVLVWETDKFIPGDVASGGGVTLSTTPPAAAEAGDLWVEDTEFIQYVYTGTEWVATTSAEILAINSGESSSLNIVNKEELAAVETSLTDEINRVETTSATVISLASTNSNVTTLSNDLTQFISIAATKDELETKIDILEKYTDDQLALKATPQNITDAILSYGAPTRAEVKTEFDILSALVAELTQKVATLEANAVTSIVGDGGITASIAENQAVIGINISSV